MSGESCAMAPEYVSLHLLSFFFLHVLVLPGYWMLQGHMLCSCERQSVGAVVIDQLRDAGKHTTALIQRVSQALAALSLGHYDVDTTLTCLQSDGVFASA